jgi:hypothetical protein
MRMIEIASPEEQIALFKLITDKVWAALAQQQGQAKQKLKSKLRTKPKASRVRRPTATKPKSFKTTTALPPPKVAVSSPPSPPTLQPQPNYQNRLSTQPAGSFAPVIPSNDSKNGIS